MRTKQIVASLLFLNLQWVTLGLAQTYDYHLEETPAVSWNRLAWQDARTLALAGVSSLASGPFAASMNPALIGNEAKLSLAFTTDQVDYEAYQYWGVNQGVRTDPVPPSERTARPAGLAACFATGKLRLAAGWYLSGWLRFPSFEFRRDYQYDQHDSYSGRFSGTESTFFLAVATPAWHSVSVGAGIEYIRGTRQVTISDLTDYYYPFGSDWERRILDVRQEERHQESLLVPVLGVQYALGGGFTLDAQLTWPLEGTAEREVTRSFLNPVDNLSIVDPATGSDPVHRPKQLTLAGAFDHRLSRSASRQVRLRLGAQADCTRWSEYRYIVFGEELGRDFENTLGLAAAAELSIERSRRTYFLRAGFRFDPQPARNPQVHLHAISGGAGARFRSLGVDLGLSLHQGTAGGVAQSHLAMSATLSAQVGSAK